MLQRGCNLYVSCSFCCSTCSQPVHLAIWKIHGKKRKAICALVLKVRIIQPLRFNGYSSWLTNNLLCLHYFVRVIPYKKQRIEKKDQRSQMQLCFESQNALLPSNNREGFHVWASGSQCTLARCSRWRLPEKYFNSPCLPASSPSPQTRSPTKPEDQPSSCPRLPCQPTWKVFCTTETATVPRGKRSKQIMRNGCFLLNRMRQKFVTWFPDMTEAKGRPQVATWAFYHTAVAQHNVAHVSYAGGWCLTDGRVTRAYVNWSYIYASAGTGVEKKLSGAWTAQIQEASLGTYRLCHFRSNLECLSWAGVSTRTLTAPLGSLFLSLLTIRAV